MRKVARDERRVARKKRGGRTENRNSKIGKRKKRETLNPEFTEIGH
jgi:hypothetical protein